MRSVRCPRPRGRRPISRSPTPRVAIVETVERLGLEIDILVNNAGFGVYGRFVDTPLATELESIQVNVVALTELTKRFLPGMVARRRGRILNVASTAGFLPGPLMAVYYATKAYVVSFSEAIANELEGTGVTVTVLCPGPTASGFQAAANLETSRIVSLLRKATSRSVAEAGYEAVMAGKVLCIPGVSNKVSAACAAPVPARHHPQSRACHPGASRGSDGERSHMISRRGFLQSGALSMIGLRSFAEETQAPVARPRASAGARLRCLRHRGRLADVGRDGGAGAGEAEGPDGRRGEVRRRVEGRLRARA